MDHLSNENDEFEIGFDDNGLKNIRLLASREGISSSACISNKARKESKFSNCEANPNGKDEDDSTKFAFDERKSCWKEPFDDERGTCLHWVLHRTVGPINDGGNKQSLPIPEKDSNGSKELEHRFVLLTIILHLFEKDGAKNVIGRRATRSGKVRAEEAKFRSGRCVKDGGGSNLEIPASLVSFWSRSFVAISWQFSVSFTVGILLLLTSAGVEGALTTAPVSTLFVIGQTARMNCSTNLNRPVYWARTLPGSDVQQWLYYGKSGFNGNNVDSRFSMDKDEATGRYDIIIADVQLMDAGQYICVDESGLGARASAELVISAPIKCNSHIPSEGVMGYNVFGIEQDVIQISCSLTYTGNLSPTVEWSWPGSVVQNDESEYSAATSSVTSTLKLFPTKEQNGIKFQCKANMKGARQPTIDSGLLWESEIVNVRYAEFASEEVAVCPGVKWNLFCNPHCSYSFERNNDDCQCLYTYNDSKTQQKYEVTSDAVSCGRGNDILLAITIAAAVVIVLATAFVLVCCLKKKNHTKRAEKHDGTTNKRLPSGASSDSGQASSDDNSCNLMLEEV